MCNESKTLNGMTLDETEYTRRTAAFWNQRHQDPEGEAHDNFMSHPLVQSYLSIRAFGSMVSQMDTIFYEIRRRTEPGDTILSVGCGLAAKESWFAEKLPDRQFVAIDLADEIVAKARARIAAQGIENLTIENGDFNQLDVGEARFDIVLGLGAIHHVENLESFWQGAGRALKPGGVIIAQEYIGASRLQWSDTQLEACNRAMRELVPDELKPHHQECRRPDLEFMLRSDPSEAVRSAEIIPTAESEGFDVHGFCSGGSALLQPILMHQIAAYDPRNWEHNRVLSALFAEEDRLMREGVLGDDFAMFVVECREQRRQQAESSG